MFSKREDQRIKSKFSGKSAKSVEVRVKKNNSQSETQHRVCNWGLTVFLRYETSCNKKIAVIML